MVINIATEAGNIAAEAVGSIGMVAICMVTFGMVVIGMVGGIGKLAANVAKDNNFIA